MIPRFLAMLSFVVVALGGAGCSEQTGLYAEAKGGWDSPRPDDTADSLRHRLAHTQRDH